MEINFNQQGPGGPGMMGPGGPGMMGPGGPMMGPGGPMMQQQAQPLQSGMPMMMGGSENFFLTPNNQKTPMTKNSSR